MRSICRKFRRPIRWVRMAKSGKNNMLDPKPDDNGNIVIGNDCLGYMVTAMNRKPPLYTSHFETCPKADHFKQIT